MKNEVDDAMCTNSTSSALIEGVGSLCAPPFRELFMMENVHGDAKAILLIRSASSPHGAPSEKLHKTFFAFPRLPPKIGNVFPSQFRHNLENPLHNLIRNAYYE